MGLTDRKAANAYAREWNARNPELRRARARRYRDKARHDAFVAYGSDPPRCICCGESDERFLTLDHVNGNGAAEREALGSMGFGHKLASRLRRLGWPPGYQVLCWNCNVASHIYGVCPHVSPAS